MKHPLKILGSSLTLSSSLRCPQSIKMGIKLGFIMGLALGFLSLFGEGNLAHAEQFASFEALYDTTSYTKWIIAGALAIGSGALVFFSGGVASPLVAGVGSWIGGMMGLSGAAATNAGLALLGGGSLASGGLGVAGGAALLTAAITFTTDIALDYSVDTAMKVLDGPPSYDELKTVSRGRINLALPKNQSGPDLLEDAVELLEDKIDEERPLYHELNAQVIKSARILLETDTSSQGIEAIRLNSAHAMLSFILDDYEQALERAKQTVKSAKEQELHAPIAQYIWGVSSLYSSSVSDHGDHLLLVRAALLKERELTDDREKFDPLSVRLLAIYYDRLLLRMISDELSESALRVQIGLIEELESSERIQFTQYFILATRYLMRLKDNQSRIRSLANSESPLIRESLKTYQVVDRAYLSYIDLLTGIEIIIAKLKTLNPRGEGLVELTKLIETKGGYQSDISALKEDHDRLKRHHSLYVNRLFIGGGAAGFVLILAFMWRRSRES